MSNIKNEFIASYEPVISFEPFNCEYKELLTIVHDRFKWLINFWNQYDYLSEEEKLRGLLKFSGFYLSYEDLAKLVNMKHGTSFDVVKTISTDIILPDPDEVLSDIFGLSLVIDCASKKEVNLENRRYSYEEIIELIKNNKIYPLFKRFINLCGDFRIDKYNIGETNTQLPYNAEDNEYFIKLLEREILKGKKVNCFVPNELKLGRNTGSGDLHIDERFINEENSMLFMQLFDYYLSKDKILEMIKPQIIYLKEVLDKSICAEEESVRTERKLIKHYYKDLNKK